MMTEKSCGDKISILPALVQPWAETQARWLITINIDATVILSGKKDSGVNNICEDWIIWVMSCKRWWFG